MKNLIDELNDKQKEVSNIKSEMNTIAELLFEKLIHLNTEEIETAYSELIDGPVKFSLYSRLREANKI